MSTSAKRIRDAHARGERAPAEAISERLAEVYADEGDGEAWWYLSFADESGFLGGLYLRALHTVDATLRAHALGLNPGGEVLGFGPIPDEAMDENVPESDRMRLLSRDELGPAGRPA